MNYSRAFSSILVLPVLLLPGWLSAQDATPSEFAVKWSIDEGIESPESAYCDEDSGFLFLSQIGKGGAMAKDGDGWISKLSIDGEMIENKWVTGFNAPKGLRSHAGTLWVADIDRLVAVDIAKGDISAVIPIEGAKFLNDVATAPDGTVYVSDMATSRIYKHQDGKTSVLTEGPQLEHPNGLLVVGERLIIAGWGSNFNAENFSTNPVGRLLSLDLETLDVTSITPQPTGNLDGLESDGRGGFYVTDWVAGRVLHISADGITKEVMASSKGTADLAYLAEEGLLILPHMLNSTLTAFEIK